MDSVGIKLARSEICRDRLVFQDETGINKALSDGFFLVKIPAKIDVAPGIKLSQNFFKESDSGPDSVYKGFKEIDSIYFDREHFQTEHILADRVARENYFPGEVNSLADQMNDVAITILKNILDYIKLPKEHWSLVTGGCVDNNGTHWFACSHYRSEIDKQGCATHQDTGFVTILYIDQPGLEAKIGSKWIKIDPTPGYFVVNFGRSFEILTEKMNTQVKSILHRVSKTHKINGVSDRISMASFTNLPNHLNLYQYHQNSPEIYQSVQDFLTEFNKTTWDDKHTDFGLTS